MINYIKF